MMGTDLGRRDEKPQHQIQLEAFRISRSEITNRQYLLFLIPVIHARRIPRSPETVWWVIRIPPP
jgi:hypothetical protein